MDYPWHHHPPPPPIAQGNPSVCPTCSFPHFPFCRPPQIPLNQNPRFQSPDAYTFHRPHVDPFVDHQSWRGNPSFGHRSYADGIASSPYDHGGCGYKRMRVDEVGVGSVVAANERRLKLIHDHGGADSMLDIGMDVIGGSDAVKRPGFSELGVGKDYMSPANYDQSFNHFRRKGTDFHLEHDLDRDGYGERHDYRNGELGQLKYSLDKSTLNPPLQANLSDSYEWRSRFSMETHRRSHFSPQPYAMRSNVQLNLDIHSQGHLSESPFGHHILPTSSPIGPKLLNEQVVHVPNTRGTVVSENTPPVGVAQAFNVQPPLPISPPPTISMDPQRPRFSDLNTPSFQAKASLFPISVTSTGPTPSSYDPFSEAHASAQPYSQESHHLKLGGFAAQDLQPVSQRSSISYSREGQRLPLIPSSKPKAVDASDIFKQPHRATRPDHIVIILRGLPGSGKSYLAKMMRDLEIENGNHAPRIHSMDDYFMTEVEKIDESDSLKSSGSARGKKPAVKAVMEYCYEPEMEEAYRSSMLKTFKKTLDDGAYSLVIVDDRNLRVADFAQFWATAKRTGYEVYLLEAVYKDPVGCAARNVHGFTLNDIQKMAEQWEEAPSLYLKLDIKSLLQGDDLKENGIQEVDMDMEDGDAEDALTGLGGRNSDSLAPASHNDSPPGPSNVNDSWNAERDFVREEVKELGRSKWSNDLDDEDANRKEAGKENPDALSGLVKAYAKEGKSVHWGDQAANTGFSIGAAKRVNASLVIGPGSGYNLKSNPLPEELVWSGNAGESKKQSVFQERIRAERESFRAVFDKRRHRAGGLDLDED